MLNLLVLSRACKDMSRAATLQGVSQASQTAASMLALLAGLSLYPCDGSPPALTPVSVFFITGAISICAALVSCYVEGPTRESIYGPSNEQYSFRTVEISMGAVLLLMTWMSVKTFMDNSDWLWFLGVVLLVFIGLFACLWAQSRHSGIIRSAWAVWPAMVLFVINSVPSAGGSLYGYQYGVYMNHVCYPQYLSITSTATSFLASAMFFAAPALFGKRTIYSFFFCGLLSAGASLLWLPWVNGVATAPTSFAYAMFSTILNQGLAQCMLILTLVVAMQSCPLDFRASLFYSFYLSSMNLGQSVSGWFTTPLVKALGITFMDYFNLGKLIGICCACLVVAMGTSVLLIHTRLGGVRDEKEQVHLLNCEEQ